MQSCLILAWLTHVHLMVLQQLISAPKPAQIAKSSCNLALQTAGELCTLPLLYNI